MGKFNFKEAPKAKPKQRPIPKSGMTPARIVRIVEIGNRDLSFDGDTKQADRVMINFETVTQKAVFDEEKGEQPFLVSKEYTLSSHPKAALVGLLKSIDKEGIETLDDLLGTPCLLNVKHNENKGITYANFGSASPPMEGIEIPEAASPLFYFSFDEPDAETAAGLYDWEKKKIMAANDYEGSKCQEVFEGENYDDEESEDVEDEANPWD